MATANERTRAELEALRADAVAKRAEAKKLAVETTNLELEVAASERRELVFDSRIIYFTSEVEDIEVAEAVERLLDFRVVSDEPVTIYLNSPGGDVFAGLMLYDLVQEMMAEGIHVTTRVTGYAASMASVLSQAGNTRSISPNSWYMVHEPATLSIGKLGDIKREAQLLERLHDQLCGILAERSNLTKAQIKQRSKDKDWWMSAQEALDLGFFDELRR